jgi:hypothetical protein
MFEIIEKLIKEQTENAAALKTAASDALKRHYLLSGAHRQAEEQLQKLQKNLADEKSLARIIADAEAQTKELTEKHPTSSFQVKEVDDSFPIHHAAHGADITTCAIPAYLIHETSVDILPALKGRDSKCKTY